MGTSTQQTPVTHRVSVAICGNPNCGKTTIFNAITGLRQKVGNYPGVTVEKIFGQFRLESHPGTEFTLYDIPGSYSLSAFSPDEYIAARALFGHKDEARPDIIVCLIDATNLERGLYLLFQTLQIGRPVIVGLNMIDLFEKRGSTVDVRKLSEALGGLPVVPLVGSKGRGLDQLQKEIGGAVDNWKGSTLEVNPASVEQCVERLRGKSCREDRTKAEYLRILYDEHGPAESEFTRREENAAVEELLLCRQELRREFGTLVYAETLPYSRKAGEVSSLAVLNLVVPEATLTGKVDRFLLHPILGPVILVMLMTFMFQSIFSWAEPVMNVVDTAFGSLAGLVEQSMEAGPLRSLLSDGIIGGVGSVLIFLPQIMILFLFIALLEDSGYMTRAAFLVDRAFSWCGLSGKSFIPMLSSFACAVPGIMATRTIEDRKLRLVTIMVAPLMSCSARLPVYTIMITAFIPHVSYFGLFNSQGVVLTALYLLGIIMAVLVSYVLKKTLYRTERGTFIMEMPTYKVPNGRSVLIRVYNRARAFVLRAGTVILAITIIIWALGYYPHSDAVTQEYAGLRHQVVEDMRQERITANPEIQLSESPDQWQLTETEQSRLDLLTDQETGAHVRNSYFARIGHSIEPVFHPLGWDWKITMSVLASFPAREVIIATLGTIFNLGSDVDASSSSLVDKMRMATWDSGEKAGLVLFTPAVALSIMVFFALSCQCGATAVTIRQEAGGWRYAVFVFVYMTLLGYFGAFAVYQLFSRMGL